MKKALFIVCSIFGGISLLTVYICVILEKAFPSLLIFTRLIKSPVSTANVSDRALILYVTLLTPIFHPSKENIRASHFLRREALLQAGKWHTKR